MRYRACHWDQPLGLPGPCACMSSPSAGSEIIKPAKNLASEFSLDRVHMLFLLRVVASVFISFNMAKYENAPNQSILVKDSKVAFRWLGPKHGIPVIHLVSFRATMSQIDPVSVNKIAEKRPVILFDSVGVGRSEGKVPTSYAGWADCCAELIIQLGFDQVDVLAFSMGGCAAQMLALNYPALVRRLILIGSLPSIGPGVVLPPPAPFQGIRMANDRECQEAALLEFCFHSSETSQAAGRATFRRMLEARDDWSDLIDTDGTRRQVQAFAKFMNPQYSSEGSFGRFNELRIPVLLIRGEYMDLDLQQAKFKA
ncbi:hypothetical protein CaCOL14_010413 [Colletotrichum acutatum]